MTNMRDKGLLFFMSSCVVSALFLALLSESAGRVSLSASTSPIA